MAMTFISYAQNGEDVILHRIFGEQKTGFYIDVGASHPEFLSVTKSLYDRGWSGINIDPRRKSIKLFEEKRPRDINLNVAIGREDGAREFFEVVNYPELSTLNREVVSKHELETIAYQVEVITGDKLFFDHVKQAVDVMKIDVEGNEYEVISSLDFRKHRPKVLVIEATIPNAVFPGWSDFESINNFAAWEPTLVESGYVFAFFDGLNRYYISEENIDFLRFFRYGLCHWDNYLLHSQTKQIAGLVSHSEESVKQIEVLTSQNAELERHCEGRMNQIELLTARIGDLEWHCEERMNQIIKLTSIINTGDGT